nr:TMV resistance protein N-like [Quercus suber]
MASTSSERPSSSYSTPRPHYDVFISFRGEDTRYAFTGHLHFALVNACFAVFRDDTNIQQGETISSELTNAIEGSQCAIIILSKNYARSKWCLDELVKIVECRHRTGQILLPVFYHVDPSVVRNQTGPFAIDIAHGTSVNNERIQKWRDALRLVANLAGWHLDRRCPEADSVKAIVEFIRNNFKSVGNNFLHTSKYLVGMESSVEEMMDLVNKRLKDVLFIGIWGVGGVGKTTLAENDTETGNLVSYQKEVLKHIFNTEFNITSIYSGKHIIRKMLRGRKVLIALDNVSEKGQLDSIVGSHDWFAQGSRIIITSEDKQLLVTHEVDDIYEVKPLDNYKALELFSRKAFKLVHPENDFVDLSNDFVKYAQGLPLALECFGSFLYSKEIDVWKSYLGELEENSEGEILTKLEIIYKRILNKNVKELFLDIAFFFKGMDKNQVANILNDPGYLANLEFLQNNSLITIFQGKLWMHDLLQAMGRAMVRHEALNEPGRRSRLWKYEDIFSVLRNNTGTEYVKGMMLNSPPCKEDLNANAFSKMKGLELIKICSAVRFWGLNHLSIQLRMMEWHDYPLKSIPWNFQPCNLVELTMPNSQIEQLPKVFNNLNLLRVMDLSYSQNLIKTPDFSGFQNLRSLTFQGCTRLYNVHPSVGALKNLTLLNLKDCESLKNLPQEIKLEYLEVLILSGCSRLKKLSEIGENMTRLSKLYLDRTAIKELPSSIKHLAGLTILNLKDCKYLLSFPSAIRALTSLEILTLSGCKVQLPKSCHLPGLSLALWTYRFFYAQRPEPEPANLLLPESFSGLSSLKSLDLSDCNLSDGALPDLSSLSSLRSLNLSKNNITRLPDAISQLSMLKLVCLDNCSKLQSLSCLSLSTKYVMARGCTSLENYSNNSVVWTSGEAGLTFINCLSFLEDEEGKITEGFLLDSLLENGGKIIENSSPDILFQPFWQSYMEDHIRESEEFYSVLNQIEIPTWFNHQNRGSDVSIPLHQYDANWTGIAVCVDIKVQKNLSEVSPGDPTDFHEFHLEVHGGPEDFPRNYKFPRDKIHVGSFGIWLYISHAKLGVLLHGCDDIRPFIKTNSPDIEIKGCGARILYERDLVQFVQILSQQIFGNGRFLAGS